MQRNEDFDFKGFIEHKQTQVYCRTRPDIKPIEPDQTLIAEIRQWMNHGKLQPADIKDIENLLNDPKKSYKVPNFIGSDLIKSPNKSEYYFWIEKGAKLQHAAAIWNMGLYFKDKGDILSAAKWFKKSYFAYTSQFKDPSKDQIEIIAKLEQIAAMASTPENKSAIREARLALAEIYFWHYFDYHNISDLKKWLTNYLNLLRDSSEPQIISFKSQRIRDAYDWMYEKLKEFSKDNASNFYDMALLGHLLGETRQSILYFRDIRDTRSIQQLKRIAANDDELEAKDVEYFASLALLSSVLGSTSSLKQEHMICVVNFLENAVLASQTDDLEVTKMTKEIEAVFQEHKMDFQEYKAAVFLRHGISQPANILKAAAYFSKPATGVKSDFLDLFAIHKIMIAGDIYAKFPREQAIYLAKAIKFYEIAYQDLKCLKRSTETPANALCKIVDDVLKTENIKTCVTYSESLFMMIEQESTLDHFQILFETARVFLNSEFMLKNSKEWLECISKLAGVAKNSKIPEVKKHISELLMSLKYKVEITSDAAIQSVFFDTIADIYSELQVDSKEIEMRKVASTKNTDPKRADMLKTKLIKSLVAESERLAKLSDQKSHAAANEYISEAAKLGDVEAMFKLAELRLSCFDTMKEAINILSSAFDTALRTQDHKLIKKCWNKIIEFRDLYDTEDPMRQNLNAIVDSFYEKLAVDNPERERNPVPDYVATFIPHTKELLAKNMLVPVFKFILNWPYKRDIELFKLLGEAALKNKDYAFANEVFFALCEEPEVSLQERLNLLKTIPERQRSEKNKVLIKELEFLLESQDVPQGLVEIIQRYSVMNSSIERAIKHWVDRFGSAEWIQKNKKEMCLQLFNFIFDHKANPLALSARNLLIEKWNKAPSLFGDFLACHMAHIELKKASPEDHARLEIDYIRRVSQYLWNFRRVNLDNVTKISNFLGSSAYTHGRGLRKSLESINMRTMSSSLERIGMIRAVLKREDILEVMKSRDFAEQRNRSIMGYAGEDELLALHLAIQEHEKTNPDIALYFSIKILLLTEGKERVQHAARRFQLPLENILAYQRNAHRILGVWANKKEKLSENDKKLKEFATYLLDLLMLLPSIEHLIDDSGIHRAHTDAIIRAFFEYGQHKNRRALFFDFNNKLLQYGARTRYQPDQHPKVFTQQEVEEIFYRTPASKKVEVVTASVSSSPQVNTMYPEVAPPSYADSTTMTPVMLTPTAPAENHDIPDVKSHVQEPGFSFSSNRMYPDLFAPTSPRTIATPNAPSLDAGDDKRIVQETVKEGMTDFTPEQLKELEENMKKIEKELEDRTAIVESVDEQKVEEQNKRCVVLS